MLEGVGDGLLNIGVWIVDREGDKRGLRVGQLTDLPILESIKGHWNEWVVLAISCYLPKILRRFVWAVDRDLLGL